MNNDRGIFCLYCSSIFEAQLATKVGNTFLCPVCHKDICSEKEVNSVKEEN